MKIDFYVGPSWEPVSPEALERGGCGGSEVALVRMAENLAKLGHVVTVFGEYVSQGTPTVDLAHGELAPIYRRHEEFSHHSGDVLVMWRNVGCVATGRPPYKQIVLWLHDLGLPTIPDPIAERIDAIFVLSEFHRNSILRNNPHMESKFRIVANGLDMSLYPEKFPEKKPHHYIYSSSPRRGLGKLLREWPAVVKAYPEATLHVAYGFDLSIKMCETVGQHQEAAIYRSMLQAIEKGIPGVVYHGRLPQKALAELQRSCVAWLYPPSDFEETFCITALEAQAAYCDIASRWNGALPEVLNYCHKWEAGKSTLDMIKLFRGPSLTIALSANYEWAATFSWYSEARRWSDYFEGKD